MEYKLSKYQEKRLKNIKIKREDEHLKNARFMQGE